ncbi:MAG TPA: hypothetical protein VMM18_06710 [Gemmatimonadaceae bacterium]|nr:hypothetical protein [Gemmatimonadaceae bacterium]
MRAALLAVALLTGAMITVPAAGAQLIGETIEQPDSPKPARGYIALGLRGAQPLGEFADYIRMGVGFGGYVAHALDARGVLSLRGTVDFMIYGHETTRHSVYGGSLDVTTSNNILAMGIGPLLMAPGNGVRPYVTATAGFSYFSTTTSLKWRHADEDLDNWTDFSDAVFAWTGGGGLLVPLRRGSRPILLDLSATYHGNGEAEYLREGSIWQDDAGNTFFTPIRSRTNMVVYTIGVSFGAW